MLFSLCAFLVRHFPVLQIQRLLKLRRIFTMCCMNKQHYNACFLVYGLPENSRPTRADTTRTSSTNRTCAVLVLIRGYPDSYTRMNVNAAA